MMTTGCRGIHVYRQRHLFKGDECIGKYEVRKRTFTLRPEWLKCEREVKAFYVKSFGIVVRMEE